MPTTFGNLVLELATDGSFVLTKPTIVWKFSKSQLETEIEKLEHELAEKQELLARISAMEAQA
jgi:hypothetical protein